MSPLDSIHIQIKCFVHGIVLYRKSIGDVSWTSRSGNGSATNLGKAKQNTRTFQEQDIIKMV
jgi:hypothetical protein